MTPVFRPSYPGEFPTLGPGVVDWMETYLLDPSAPEKKLRLTNEQKAFVYNLLMVDETGRRAVIRRGVFQRPKGAGKSPIAAAILLALCLADAVPDGFDADGRPVGRPRTSVGRVVAALAGVNESQVANAFVPALTMVSQDLQDDYVCVPKDTAIHLENRGIIRPLTSSSRGVEGMPTDVVVCDQTESWSSYNLRAFHGAILRNTAKRRGLVIETPNAPVLTGSGDGSVAEQTMRFVEKASKAGALREVGILYDNRTPEKRVDVDDDEAVMEALRFVYGDSAIEAGGWVDLEWIAKSRYDEATTEDDFRRFFLNQPSAGEADSFVTPDEVDGASTADTIPEGSRVVLGFDGSTGSNRTDRLADATALVALHLDSSPPLIERIGLWSETEPGSGWTAPLDEIEEAMEAAFRAYRVVGFFGDPSKGYGQIFDRISGRFGHRLRVKAGRDPIAFYPTSGRNQVLISEALQLMAEALRSGELALAEDPDLRAHFLNARRRDTKTGWRLYKATPMSPHKIDLAYASLMAFIAYRQWIASGGARSTKAVREAPGGENRTRRPRLQRVL